jgi:dTDP-4-dehydrorhamnose reductase
MDKALVIGASGLLGYNAMLFGSKEYEMYGTYHTHEIEGKNLSRLDATKKESVQSLIESVKPDLVIDAHTLPNVDYSEEHTEEAWDINVNGTKNLAEAAKAHGAKFVYISTAFVFDGTKGEYFETDAPNPINYYGKTKWASELLLTALNVDHIVIRTALLYGTGGTGKASFVPWVINKLMKNEEVEVITDQSLNPTFVDRLVETLFRLHERDAGGVFHVTDKECLSKYDLSVAAAKIFGLDDKLITPTTSAKMAMIAKRPGKVRMNSDKVERETGIKMLKVTEGLKIFKSRMDSEGRK